MRKLLILSAALIALTACGPKAEQQALQNMPDDFILSSVNGPQWSFNQTIEQKPVLVVFAATWCGYCKQMIPLIDKMAADYKDKADIVVAFIDEDPTLAQAALKDLSLKNVKVLYGANNFAGFAGVEGFPHIILFKQIIEGQQGQAAQWVGYSAEHVQQIKAKLNEYLK